MQPKTTKSVCAQVDKEHRDMLAYILNHTKRKLKGQIELWIETEHRLIQMNEVRK